MCQRLARNKDRSIPRAFATEIATPRHIHKLEVAVTEDRVRHRRHQKLNA
jgi:hypothetical protein